MGAPLKQAIERLGNNIAAGSRLALFKNNTSAKFRISLDQTVLMVLVGAALMFIYDLLFSLPDPSFNAYGFPGQGYSLACFLLATFITGKLFQKSNLMVPIVLGMYSTLPMVFAAGFISTFIQTTYLPNSLAAIWSIYIIFMAWTLAIIAYLYREFASAKPKQMVAAVLIFITIWVVPTEIFSQASRFWYPGQKDTADAYATRYKPYEKLDAESLLYKQADMINQTLKALAPHRKNMTDLYFIGFAGYAMEDVFKKEAEFTRNLFDRKFDTNGHSVLLINNLTTTNTLPLATATNLKLLLNGIGRRMDRDEDLIVLYLTSHGSRKNGLSVGFWPMRLNDITPIRLKSYLDGAGIKWRIIIVSSCYSGQFIETLKTDYTFIVTASAPERRSFGCTNDRDFTYFGESFVRDHLNSEYSFVKAYHKAAKAIEAREKLEGLSLSKPQIFIGTKIAAKLDALETKFKAGNQ